MLSILVPTFNYDISSLVHEIHNQATKANIKFEIVCFEDGSDKHTYKNKLAIESLTCAKIISSEINFGRTKSRQILANESIYDWLLFLDADVLPKNDSFIEKYVIEMLNDNDAIYGGLTYKKEKPESRFLLRWKYGKTYEGINANKRNMKPYQVIVSGNFLIRKNVFNLINSKIKKVGYGLDNYFAALLKQNNYSVLHINNEVYHLGIEKSTVYLNKVEECIITLLWLYNENKMFEHNNRLLSVFNLFKRFKLNYLMVYFYNIFSSKIKNNLLGTNPNMYLLQIYKLSFICYKDLNP